MNYVVPEMAEKCPSAFEPLYVRGSNIMKPVSLSRVIFRVELCKLKMITEEEKLLIYYSLFCDSIYSIHHICL
jgi:hypothetical protein